MIGLLLMSIGAVVAGFEIVLLLMGLLALVRGANAAADELFRRQAADIVARAEVGQTPEWHQYDQGLAERLADREDSLRVYSSMALTVGVAGTMASMAAVLLLAPGDTDLFDVVLRHIGMALAVSSFGVVCHLVLAAMSRAAHGGARAHHARRMAELRTIAEQTEPARAAQERTRVENQRTQALQEGLVDAVRTSLASLPEALEDLEERIEAIGKLLAQQDQALRETTNALAGSTAKIEASTTQLGAMSERIAVAGESVAMAPARMAVEVEKLGATVATVTTGLQALPKAIEEELRRSLREWAEEQRGQNVAIQSAYRDATETVRAASGALAEEVRQLSGRWQTTAENSLRVVMEDVRSGLVSTILAGIRDPMLQVGNEFVAAGAHAKEIHATLAKTSGAVAEWQTTVEKLLAEAQAVAERTRGREDERTLQALRDLQQAIRQLAADRELAATEVVRASPETLPYLVSADTRLARLVDRAVEPWPARLVGDLGTWWRGAAR